MKDPIDNLYPLRVMPKIIGSLCYNRARLALMRISNPLRVAIPDHRGLDIILYDSYWLCVDSIHDDQAIMAWREFDTQDHNSALHHPIPCKLCLFHTHAGLIMGSALDSLEIALSKILKSFAENPGCIENLSS